MLSDLCQCWWLMLPEIQEVPVRYPGLVNNA